MTLTEARDRKATPDSLSPFNGHQGEKTDASFVVSICEPSCLYGLLYDYA